jgi:heme/copper-type cytochrome/quinol oxidase subunit 2
MSKGSRIEAALKKDQQEERHAKDTKMYFWTLAIIFLFVTFTLWYFS